MLNSATSAGRTVTFSVFVFLKHMNSRLKGNVDFLTWMLTPKYGTLYRVQKSTINHKITVTHQAQVASKSLL
jgi:hypothetical protein